MADTDTKACEDCGASVYPEHIKSNKAGVWAGKLYCIHCYAEHKSTQVTIDPDDFGSVSPPREVPVSQPVENDDSVGLSLDAEVLDDDPDDPSLDLGDDGLEPAEGGDEGIQLDGAGSKRITAIATGQFGGAAHSEGTKFTRHLNHNGQGAMRIRIYHAKLNDGALRFMEDQLNEWVDGNPDVEIKHATTQIGVVEGKHAEPHLIVTVFY